MVLWLFLLTRCVERRSGARPWHVAPAFMVALACHKIMFFLAPAMLLLFMDSDGRLFQGRSRAEVARFLTTLILGLLILQIPNILYGFGVKGVLVSHLNNPILELLTLPKFLADPVAGRSQEGAFQLFYFGSLAHFRYFFGFLFLAAPLAFFALCAQAIRRRISWGNPLVIAAGCGLIWAFLWHPHMGWRDWDLFAMAFIPLNLWAATAIDPDVPEAV